MRKNPDYQAAKAEKDAAETEWLEARLAFEKIQEERNAQITRINARITVADTKLRETPEFLPD